MSHIIVHRIEQIALRNAARLAQIKALPPQLTRGDFNAWDLNRKGYQHDTSWPRRSDGADPGLVADAPTDAGLGGGEQPRQTSAVACKQSEHFLGLLHRTAVGAETGFLCVSLPWVGYPFRIKAARLTQYFWNGNGRRTWNVVVGTDDYTNNLVSVPPSGESMVRVSGSHGLFFVGQGPDFGPRVRDQTEVSVLDFPEGKIFPAGTRPIVAVALLTTIAYDFVAEAHVLIEECRPTSGGGGGGPPPPPSGGGGAPTPDWTEIF